MYSTWALPAIILFCLSVGKAQLLNPLNGIYTRLQLHPAINSYVALSDKNRRMNRNWNLREHSIFGSVPANFGSPGGIGSGTIFSGDPVGTTITNNSINTDYSTSYHRLVDGFTQCLRQCNGIPKSCYFRLHIERYPVLGGACQNCAFGNQSDCMRPQCVTANGFFRNFIAVNRQLPAPSIQVCRGDRIIADVENVMPDQSTSIHWHGIRQRNSQYYDGVPYVTQCPISPGTTFRYNFVVKNSGTYFYHSHTGIQNFDGFAGPLIIRDIKDSQSKLYDEDLPEHVIFVGDWTNRPGEQYLPGFNNPDLGLLPDSFLINGRAPIWAANQSVNLPLTEYVVKRGVRYRFRLIGGTSMICSISLQFQGHTVIVISADGNLKFAPRTAYTIILNAADRFDVILEANQKEETYFIFAEGVQPFCGKSRGIAILRYSSSNTPVVVPPPPSGPKGKVFNPINTACDEKNPNEICISHLRGDSNAPAIGKRSHKSIVIGFNFYFFNNDLFAPGTYQIYEEPVQGRRVKALVNNVSFTFPPSPMISQFKDIPQSSFCAPQCYSPAIQKACSCTNYYNLPYKAIINVIIYDLEGDSGLSHPFHLHGYNFYILGMGVFPSNNSQERQHILTQLMTNLTKDTVDLRSRPQRDTINIPSRGYVLTRFFSNNPGFWFLHCHFVFHLEHGMSAVFRVGDQRLLPPVPRNFPKCGNFLTRI